MDNHYANLVQRLEGWYDGVGSRSQTFSLPRSLSEETLNSEASAADPAGPLLADPASDPAASHLEGVDEAAEDYLQALQGAGESALLHVVRKYHEALLAQGLHSEAEAIAASVRAAIIPAKDEAETEQQRRQTLLTEGLRRYFSIFSRSWPPVPVQVVEFEDLSYCHPRKMSWGVDSLWKSTMRLLRRTPNDHAPRFAIDSASGYLMPGSMTLVLGPVGSGKSTLMSLLSGRLKTPSGSVTYNKKPIKSLIPERLAGLGSQSDQHLGSLTILETLEFARPLVNSVLATELDLDSEARQFLEEALEEGQDVLVQSRMGMLGLTRSADARVGSRNVTDDERHRLTTAELLLGPNPVLFFDQVSRTFDGPASFRALSTIQAYAQVRRVAVACSLIWPTQDVFRLFDHVLVMAEGRVIFHGTREEVLPYFRKLGYVKPIHLSVPEFVQDVPSAGGHKYLAGGVKHLTVYEFAAAYQQSAQRRNVERILRGDKPRRVIWIKGPATEALQSITFCVGVTGVDSEESAKSGKQGRAAVVVVASCKGERDQLEDGWEMGHVERTGVVREGDQVVGLAVGPEAEMRFLVAVGGDMAAEELMLQLEGCRVTGKRIRLQLERDIQTSNPVFSPESNVYAAQLHKPFLLSMPQELHILVQRQLTLTMRNKFLLLARLIQVVMLALFNAFNCLQMPSEPPTFANLNLRRGIFVLSLLTMTLNCISQLPSFLAQSAVAQKHVGMKLFRPTSWVVADFLVGVPFSMAEALIWTCIAYPISGLTFSDSGAHFFVFLAVMALIALHGSALVRFLAFAGGPAHAAYLTLFISPLFFLFAHFFLPGVLIRPYWIWAYLIDPVQWAGTMLMNNEFLSSAFATPCAALAQDNLSAVDTLFCRAYPEATVGEAYLELYQWNTGAYVWVVGPAVIVGWICIYLLGTAACLGGLVPRQLLSRGAGCLRGLWASLRSTGLSKARGAQGQGRGHAAGAASGSSRQPQHKAAGAPSAPDPARPTVAGPGAEHVPPGASLVRALSSVPEEAASASGSRQAPYRGLRAPTCPGSGDRPALEGHGGSEDGAAPSSRAEELQEIPGGLAVAVDRLLSEQGKKPHHASNNQQHQHSGCTRLKSREGEPVESHLLPILEDSTVPFPKVLLTWHSLSYEVFGSSSDGGRELVHNASGWALPGEIFAIAGGPGTGKTTLLNVLSGRKLTGRLKGQVFVNGELRRLGPFIARTSYVERGDQYYPFLTVQESMLYRAAMLLPRGTTTQARHKFVDELLDIFELKPVAGEVVLHLLFPSRPDAIRRPRASSQAQGPEQGAPGHPRLGGQASTQGTQRGGTVDMERRVVVAMEIAGNPSVIFLDQPFVGMDLPQMTRFARILKRVTSICGRSIVLTTIMPPVYLLDSFDRIAVIKKGGVTTYLGPCGSMGSSIIEYFESIPGSPRIPRDRNPMGFIQGLMEQPQASGSTSKTRHRRAAVPRDYAFEFRLSSLALANEQFLRQLKRLYKHWRASRREEARAGGASASGSAGGRGEGGQNGDRRASQDPQTANGEVTSASGGVAHTLWIPHNAVDRDAALSHGHAAEGGSMPPEAVPGSSGDPRDPDGDLQQSHVPQGRRESNAQETQEVAQWAVQPLPQLQPSKQPYWWRLLLVSWMMQLTYWRNRGYTVNRWLYCAILGFIVGTNFYQLPKDTLLGVLSQASAVFAVALYGSLANAGAAVALLSQLTTSIRRERVSNQYFAGLYNISFTLAEIMYLSVNTLTFAAISSGLSGVAISSAAQFFSYWFTFLLVALSTAYFGLLLAAAFPNFRVASVVIPVVTGVWVATAGMLVPLSQMQGIFQFCFWINPLQYALDAMTSIAFYCDTTSLACQSHSEECKCVRFVSLLDSFTWNFLQDSRSLRPYALGFDWLFLICFCVLCRLGALASLKLLPHNQGPHYNS